MWGQKSGASNAKDEKGLIKWTIKTEKAFQKQGEGQTETRDMKDSGAPRNLLSPQKK